MRLKLLGNKITSLSSILATVRQLRYPAQLRIHPIALNPSDADFARVLHTIQSTPPACGAYGNREAEQTIRVLADLGTGLWRLKQRMIKPGTNRALDEMSRAYRHLESTWDVLAAAGIEIVDHTDTPFEAGMQVKVLAFEPRAGTSRDRIVETIKPSVYHGSELIQMGEVIVSSPEKIKSCE